MSSAFATFCSGRRPGARSWSLVALLFLLAVWGPPTAASNYKCGNPNSGHCYGQTAWQEQPQYFGSYVDLLQVAMNCPAGCGGFINNEMWLADTQSPACVANQFNACWVEAGFHATDGGGNPIYFWADSRPLSSSTYNNHYLNQADLVDLEHFMIIKDARNGAQGVFQVWIYNDSHSVFFNGTSTSNNMSANTIHIGSELAGTNGASAGQAQFQRNIWAVKALGPEFVFWYNRQIDEGSVRSDSPPTALWLINPSLPPPEGGLFTTTCCG
jgi:hypothetical protein